ncbi:MAG: glycoside hydrolase family 3 N-terminal domain-containing protein [Bacilli bacterium]
MDKVIKKICLEDKAKMLCGYKTMNTYPIESLNVPSLQLSDGPNGVRMEDKNGDSLNGVSSSLPATCFPSGVSLASSWNENLLNEIGGAIGEECNYYNINVLLGPAINIKRNPKCGRNFEYYSEDPLLSGYLGSAFVKGVQSKNVAACPKHYACNNNEKYRFTGDSIVDQRALHEIYLKPFEIVVKKSSPWAIMNSYNKINGINASQNSYVLDEVLKKKWGFNGIVMTDWGGIVDRVEGLKAGTDLEMPGMVEHNIQEIIKATKSGRINESIVNKSVDNIIKTISRTKDHPNTCDFDEHYRMAIKAAKEGAVLLRNNNNILPLNKEEKIAIIGGLFNEMRYQGSGSSLLNPHKLSYHKDAFDIRNINYSFIQGYNASELNANKKLEKEVLNSINEYDTILFYCGQNDYVESEGFDREVVTLPDNQISLLNKIINLGKKIILVLFGGSMIELPFIENVEAILYMGLAGEGCGEATTQLLFGEACPSGRLIETWPLTYDDVPFGDKFTSSPNEVYKESIFVGYRYYETRNHDVRFPFGFGMSYSDFKYSSLILGERENEIVVSCTIENLKDIYASEVVQVYVSKKDSSIYRPFKELKGFKKVEFKPFEKKIVQITIPKEDLKVYDVHKKKFILEDGNYKFIIGKNAREELLSNTLEIVGDKIKEDNELTKKYYWNLDNLISLSDADFIEITHCSITPYVFNKKPYTFETPIGEYKSFVGKIFRSAVCGVGLRQYKKGCKMKDGPEKEREKKTGLFVYKLMPCNSLRSLCYSSSGGLSYKVAQALIEFINGHYIRGIKKLVRKEK